MKIVSVVTASACCRVQGAQIGKADLEQARDLLSQARNELEPRQWELLDRKLTEAEKALERFNTAARASGKAAEVARDVDGLAEAARASEAVEGAAEAGGAAEAAEGIAALSSVAPLLGLLAALWPASTAGPDVDRGPPPSWLDAQRDFEARLKEVSKAAQRVKSEIEATRRASPRKMPRAPEVRVFDDGWKSEPGKPRYRRCFHKGTEGNGSFRPKGAPVDWMTCVYQCGRYQVRLFDVRGQSEDDCKQEGHLKRAEKAAEIFDGLPGKGL